MKTVTHTLYPVSMTDSETGKQLFSLWSFKPTGESIWCGEPIQVEAQHEETAESHRHAQIAELEAKLARLKGAA